MSNNKLIGIDLAKNTFQICALNQANKVLFNKKISRNKLTEFMQQQDPTVVAMEACGSSNYWARVFIKMGHTVQLVPAQHVKPFVRGNKNDRNDALAICETSLRPNMKYVTIKTHEQQDLQMLHRIRQLSVKSKTSVSNQLRAYLSEYGIIIPKQNHNLIKRLPSILADDLNELSTLANGSQFSKGRQMSAWIGLTPAHFGTGGKNTNVDTSKKGDPYLRALLIHGARTVVTWSKKKTDPLSLWIKRLVERRGKRKTYVALANKLARVAWCILQGEHYKLSKISQH
jgi:transposase